MHGRITTFTLPIGDIHTSIGSFATDEGSVRKPGQVYLEMIPMVLALGGSSG